jgi:glycosyltransferase involved in cell wall biosynthesis
VPNLVVIAEQLLAPVPGGTGRYSRELALALAKAAPPGWTVSSVVARHSDPALAVIPGVEGPRMLPLSRRALIAAWDRGVPLWPGGDAVHAPTPLAPARPKRGRGLVVTVHDAVPWTHPEALTKRGAAWHRRVITRAARRASALVVPTAAVAAELAEHAPGRAGVHVVGEGVTGELARTPDERQSEALARRLRLPRRYLLTIGTLEPRKGLDVLLAALTKPHAPDLPLVVVGQPGWGGVDPHRLAAQVGLSRERLHVLGRISDADLAVVLRRAAALVAPSLAEGFGLPVLEAMAAGVPVVHSDAPALVEVAGGAGVTVQRRDPISLASGLRAVLTDERRTATLVEAGRRRAAHYTWQGAATQIWRIHLELYQGRRI